MGGGGGKGEGVEAEGGGWRGKNTMRSLRSQSEVLKEEGGKRIQWNHWQTATGMRAVSFLRPLLDGWRREVAGAGGGGWWWSGSHVSNVHANASSSIYAFFVYLLIVVVEFAGNVPCVQMYIPNELDLTCLLGPSPYLFLSSF